MPTMKYVKRIINIRLVDVKQMANMIILLAWCGAKREHRAPFVRQMCGCCMARLSFCGRKRVRLDIRRNELRVLQFIIRWRKCDVNVNVKALINGSLQEHLR